MALFLFTSAILENRPIKIFNNGNMLRDFTYIEDIIEGIFGVIKNIAVKDHDFDFMKPNIATSWAPYRLFNIGNSSPTHLTYFIELLEKNLGKKAIKNFQPMQPGDVVSTAARMDLLNSWVEYKPTTSIENGIKLFSEWYLDYFKNTFWRIGLIFIDYERLG